MPQPSQSPTLAGTLGERPWTAKRAYLVRMNDGVRINTSEHPGQDFVVPQSTIYVFDEDVSCAELRYLLGPKDWRPGKHYLQMHVFGTWPFPAGGAWRAGARVDPPSEMHVETHVSMNGAASSQGFTGPVRVVSADGNRAVLDLDLSSPNRFGPNYGDLRGTVEVMTCIRPTPWATH
jgi:hypothetical protein